MALRMYIQYAWLIQCHSKNRLFNVTVAEPCFIFVSHNIIALFVKNPGGGGALALSAPLLITPLQFQSLKTNQSLLNPFQIQLTRSDRSFMTDQFALHPPKGAANCLLITLKI